MLKSRRVHNQIGDRSPTARNRDQAHSNLGLESTLNVPCRTSADHNNMKKTVFIFDLDQTLIDRFSTDTLSQVNFDLFSQLRRKGRSRRCEYIFGILSNSCFESARRVINVDEQDHFDFMLFENGAVKIQGDQILPNFADRDPSYQNARTIVEEYAREHANSIREVSYKHFTIAIHLVNPAARTALGQKINEAIAPLDWIALASHPKVLELSPRALNKTYGLDRIMDEFPGPHKIYFIGDQMHPRGNDYPLAIDPRVDTAVEVRNVMDTEAILQNLLTFPSFDFDDHALLAGTTARIIQAPRLISKIDEIKDHIDHIFLDFDGTLTLNQSQIYFRNIEVIERLKSAGKRVWIITGRSWGWCDMLVQTLPVDGIIGENGAFALYWTDGSIKKWTSERIDTEYREKKQRIKAQIEEALPDTIWASDQHFREYDLAAITSEHDVSMPDQDQNTLLSLANHAGATTALSSIHINIWFGHYDKARSLVDFMQDTYQLDTHTLQESSLFIGDSPNDEPIFRLLEHSFSVSNIKAFLPRLKYPPSHITEENAGLGAFQVLSKIADNRTSQRIDMQATQNTLDTSVIIPCLEGLEKLENTILSFVRASQHLGACRDKRVELILVDNNSPVSSSIAALGQRYREMIDIIIIQQPKLASTFSLCDARNRGVMNARGEFIFFTDSDCMVPPDFFVTLDSFTQTMNREDKWVLTGERVFVRAPKEVNLNDLSKDYFEQLDRCPSASNYGLIKDRRFPWIENLPNEEHPWNFVHGCFMFMPKQAYVDVGGSDTRYDGNWGYEEIELIHEIVTQTHSEVYFTHQAKVYHQEFSEDLAKINENEYRSDKSNNPNWIRICEKIDGFKRFKSEQFSKRGIACTLE